MRRDRVVNPSCDAYPRAGPTSSVSSPAAYPQSRLVGVRPRNSDDFDADWDWSERSCRNARRCALLRHSGNRPGIVSVIDTATTESSYGRSPWVLVRTV